MERIRMFLLRTMRHEGDIAVGIVEVDKDGSFINSYSMFLGECSRRQAYRTYSNWLLDFVNDEDKLIEVKTCDKTATDPKKQHYPRLKYYNSRRLIWHSYLNHLTTEALKSKVSKEMEINENRTTSKTKEILSEQTKESKETN